MPIFAIAKNTLKGYVKERVPGIVLIFALLLIISSYVLSPLAVGAQQKIIVDIGLAAVSLFGVLMIVLLGASSFYREKEQGILTTVLSKPISRVDFLLGKYLGTIFTVIMVMLLMAVVFFGMLLLSKASITGDIVWAVYLSIIEVMLIAAIMVLFSSFSSPILSAFFTVCIFIIGHLSKDILAFGQQFASDFTKTITKLSFYILPNLSLFNIRQEAVHGLPLQEGFLASATIYGVFYTAFVLLISALIFRSREVA